MPKDPKDKSSLKNSLRESFYERSKYINNSLEFSDWAKQLGLERTWVGRVARFMDERLHIRELLVILGFILVLGYVVFLDFDFTYSVRAGQRANRDIKSPFSFEMNDEIGTEEKRLQAENGIPLVFDYDRSSTEIMLGRVYVSFRKMRELSAQIKWARDDFERDLQVREFFKYKAEFEQLLAKSMSDPIFEWLAFNRFSKRIENATVELLEKWSQFRVVEGLYNVVPPGLNQVLVREVSRGGRGVEYMIPVREIKDLSRDEDFSEAGARAMKYFNLPDQKNVVRFARALISPNLTFNKQETEDRKGNAREQVLPVVISIKKNQILVPQDSNVQEVHVQLLNKIENLHSGKNRRFIGFVSSVLFLVVLIVNFSFLRRFTLNQVKVSSKDMAIMGVTSIVIVAVTKVFVFLTNTAVSTVVGDAVPDMAFVYAAPAAAGAMLIGLLLVSGELVWIFIFFLSLVLSFTVEQKFAFFVVSLIGGIAGARGVQGCKQRNDIYWAGLRTGLVSALVIALMTTIQSFNDERFASLLLWYSGAGLLGGVFSSFLTMMTIPFFESVFNCTTDVKLLELSNLNHPLLKEMIVKAPGTYHHSLVVGSMVEAAAEQIGANPLLAKVMSYYHDIGKTEHASYFIENQKPGNNPHDQLSPHMSKTILIAHIKDGVELGMRHKLGKPIIDGIVQHHGTTLIAYFYNRAMESQNAAIDNISEEDFRYPGPKPQFREAALIMLADSIEAASRSLDEPTPMRLQNIVRNIIQRKFMEGQLDECDLNLKDLSAIEESFIRILLGIYHQRIDYPRRAGGGASETPSTPLRPSVRKGQNPA